MMRRMLTTLRCSFARFKEANPAIGQLGEAPNLKAKELDKFRRFFQRSHLHLAGKEHPNFGKNPHDLVALERNEIETRILRVIRDLEVVELKNVKFDADFRRELRIDSLNVVALLTSIEHEFTTVFEDNVFEGIKTLNEVVTILMRDPKII